MANENAQRDQNYVPVMMGVTDDVSQEIRQVRIDPITKRLLISAIISGVASNLTVEEIDGVPSVANVTKIKVTNGTLTDDGAGVVTLTIGGAGGSPGGSTTQLQYNNAGSFGGVSTATFDGTNLSLNSTLRLTDSTDATKKVALVLSGITTATTRTWTFPDTDGTFARTSGTNTFTGVQTMTSPSITTSIVTGSTTFSAFNTTATTLNFGGAATTLNVGGTPTATITHNYSVNATASGNTKTLNIGTGGAAGSTTNVNIGSSVAGTTTISSTTTAISGVLTGQVIRANSSAGVEIQNSGGTNLIIAGAGGGTGISLQGTTNIGSASADYIQVAGGTGSTTQTATGSSTNININLVPKGAGRLQAGGVNVPTISSTDTITNKTISGASNTITNLDASNLSSGTVATARLGSGTANSTTFLRGDQTWQTVSGGDEYALSAQPRQWYVTPIAITPTTSFAATVSTNFSCNGQQTFGEFNFSSTNGNFRFVSSNVNGSSLDNGAFNTATSWRLSWRMKIPSSGNTFFGFATNDTASYHSDMNATIGSARIGFTFESGTVRTMTDNASAVTTNIVTVTPTNWNLYEIEYSQTTPDVKFYLNETLIFTHTVNVPSSAFTTFYWGAGSSNAKTLTVSNIIFAQKV